MMYATVLCLLAVSHFTSGASIAVKDGDLVQVEENPDIHLSCPELIAKYGYPVETHKVQTDDGYILEMHRIPYGRNSPEAPNKPIAFVQHGLLSSSADWIVMGPEKGLGYILADAGYDVWLGNYRGNTYSKQHVSKPTSDGSFWDFSWHEMGMLDLPAMIDYALQVTGQPNLFYIGHSMGSTTFYVMASMRPEYNAKIRAMFSLAPIAYMNHMTSPLIRVLAVGTDQLEFLSKLFGIHEFLPSNEFMTLIGSKLCHDEAITQSICSNIMFLGCGFDSQELNDTMLPVLLSHIPAGASTKSLIHYGQLKMSGIGPLGKFRQYDYGLIKNLKRYGSIHPPKYPLDKITAPVALHYSKNDWMAGVTDVERLYKELGNPIGKFLVPFSKFNHLDYLWAIHGKEYVYDKVISLMSKY